MRPMVVRRIARWGGAVIGLAGLVGGAVAATPLTFAYGTDHLYEITLSYNCQDASICAPAPFAIGGIWGWLEPATGGSVDGQIQFQGHNNTNPALNGTGHSSSFLGWSIISCPGAAACALLGAEAVPTDPNSQYFEIIAEFPGLGPLPVLTPATPGHYSAHPAPGVSSNATVTKLQ